MVVDAIHYRDRHLQHYRVHSYVVMPNHVHLLMTALVAVSKVMQSLKRFTATQGNRTLGRTGSPFWQDESYDRLVRNEREFQQIAHYIEMNPVKSGLAVTPDAFPWSSAGPIGNRPQVVNLPHTTTCGTLNWRARNRPHYPSNLRPPFLLRVPA